MTSTPLPHPYHLRPATEADAPAIVGLIRELAEFEHLTHLVQATPERLVQHLFGSRPMAEAVVVTAADTVVAFALFFHNYSTFLTRPGLYLEDLYVQPAHRGAGLGKALLRHLAQLAGDRPPALSPGRRKRQRSLMRPPSAWPRRSAWTPRSCCWAR